MAGDCGSTCPVEGGFYSYDPNIVGNAVLLAAYVLLIPVVLYMGIRFRTPAFSAVLTTGLLLDVAGFVGRMLLRGARDNQGYFALSLLGTVLGPSLMTGSIFLILPHLLGIYGEQLSPCRPTLAGLLFNVITVVSVIIQVVGVICLTYDVGGITRMQGADILSGGLGLQALALFGVVCLYFWFTLGLSDGRHFPDPKYSPVYRAPQFSRFLRGIEVTTTIHFAYSIYRVVELATGINGSIFQSQAAFMVVDGAIPLIVCILLTIFHPGVAFGQAWDSTSVRRFQRRAPPPLHPGIRYATHHRYDPNIRKQFTPPSGGSRPRYSNPPMVPNGSPGLPSSPRPSHKLPSPIVSSPMSTMTAATSNYSSSKRLSERSDRRAQAQTDLVNTDAIW